MKVQGSPHLIFLLLYVYGAWLFDHRVRNSEIAWLFIFSFTCHDQRRQICPSRTSELHSFQFNSNDLTRSLKLRADQKARLRFRKLGHSWWVRWRPLETSFNEILLSCMLFRTPRQYLRDLTFRRPAVHGNHVLQRLETRRDVRPPPRVRLTSLQPHRLLGNLAFVRHLVKQIGLSVLAGKGANVCWVQLCV